MLYSLLPTLSKCQVGVGGITKKWAATIKEVLPIYSMSCTCMVVISKMHVGDVESMLSVNSL